MHTIETPRLPTAPPVTQADPRGYSVDIEELEGIPLSYKTVVLRKGQSRPFISKPVYCCSVFQESTYESGYMLKGIFQHWLLQLFDLLEKGSINVEDIKSAYLKPVFLNNTQLRNFKKILAHAKSIEIVREVCGSNPRLEDYAQNIDKLVYAKLISRNDAKEHLSDAISLNILKEAVNGEENKLEDVSNCLILDGAHGTNQNTSIVFERRHGCTVQRLAYCLARSNLPDKKELKIFLMMCQSANEGINGEPSLAQRLTNAMYWEYGYKNLKFFAFIGDTTISPELSKTRKSDQYQCIDGKLVPSRKAVRKFYPTALFYLSVTKLPDNNKRKRDDDSSPDTFPKKSA